MSIGATFLEAREAKGVTPSQAAKATRMKVQHVEAMEADDFSVMAAPAYARGFIKLYAEYLDLDPAPLLQEYNEVHAPQKRAPLVQDSSANRPERKPVSFSIDWGVIKKWMQALDPNVKKTIAIGGGVVLVAVLVVVMFSTCSRDNSRPPPGEVNRPPSGAALEGVIETAPDLYWMPESGHSGVEAEQ